MGHGASSLTKAQKEEVSRLMQKVLDECKANGTSDADAQTKLTAEYMKLTQKYSKDSENAEPTKKKWCLCQSLNHQHRFSRSVNLLWGVIAQKESQEQDADRLIRQ